MDFILQIIVPSLFAENRVALNLNLNVSDKLNVPGWIEKTLLLFQLNKLFKTLLEWLENALS